MKLMYTSVKTNKSPHLGLEVRMVCLPVVYNPLKMDENEVQEFNPMDCKCIFDFTQISGLGI